MKAELAAGSLPPYTLREVDIEGDAELEAALGRSIPVLEIGGRTAFKGRLDPAQLVRKFERLSAAWRANEGRDSAGSTTKGSTTEGSSGARA